MTADELRKSYQLWKLLTKEQSKNVSEEFEPFSVDEFNDRINKSMLDSKAGNLIENKDLLSKVQKW
jgi:hypothetical protein